MLLPLLKTTPKFMVRQEVKVDIDASAFPLCYLVNFSIPIHPVVISGSCWYNISSLLYKELDKEKNCKSWIVDGRTTFYFFLLFSTYDTCMYGTLQIKKNKI